jgi:hypothetical protein
MKVRLLVRVQIKLIVNNSVYVFSISINHDLSEQVTGNHLTIFETTEIFSLGSPDSCQSQRVRSVFR